MKKGQKRLTYRQQLKSKKWQSKREKILSRDGYKCVLCDSTNNLQIHHGYYVKGLMAWQHPMDCLATVCRKCHLDLHNTVEIQSFTKKQFKLYLQSNKSRMRYKG